jgi:uncharacterized membrane protein
MTTLTPLIATHMGAALLALVIGPVVLWSRRGQGRVAPGRPGGPRPGLHRALGMLWVLMMVVAAFTAAFIRSVNLPNIAGFSPIHLLIPLTLGTLVYAFVALRRGRIGAHRKAMLTLYLNACVVAGAFTLLPGRYLGQLVWGQWLGWL